VGFEPTIRCKRATENLLKTGRALARTNIYPNLIINYNTCYKIDNKKSYFVFALSHDVGIRRLGKKNTSHSIIASNHIYTVFEMRCTLMQIA
jgi:hypothetical protein